MKAYRITLLSLAALGGCGGGADAGSSSPGAPQDGGANSVSPDQDAGATTADASTESGTSEHRNEGQVNSLIEIGSFLGSASLTARFQVAPDPACTERIVGVWCTLLRCPGETASPKLTSAGEVRVESASPSYLARTSPQADDSYSGPTPANAAFTGEEELSFSAAGGKISGFRTSLRLPLVLLLDEPTAATSGPTSVSTKNDLVLRWRRGSPDVALYLQSSTRKNASFPGLLSVTCRVPSSAGAATIPREVLTAFIGESLRLYTAAETTVRHGDFETRILSATNVFDPSKTRKVELQLTP